MKKEVYVSVSTDPISEYQLIYEYARQMQGHADFLHCDVMDGKFVPKITYDHQLVNNINQNSSIMLDVHLMCDEPLDILDDYLDAGANIVTVHYEAFKDKENLLRAFNKIHSRYALVGLAINPQTKLSDVKIYLHMVDLVLVMSVEPGESGQKFMPEAIDKIKALNDIRIANEFNYKIEVDGGVNGENISSIVDSGADMVVSGSYVYSAKNQIEAINELKGV